VSAFATVLAVAAVSVGPAPVTEVLSGPVLHEPSSYGTTVVGLLPGRGSTSSLGVSVDGGPATRIPALAPVGSRAVPHLGTDAQGRVVVVYPRCVKGRCDLYSARPDGTHEQRVPGVNAPGESQFQGAMDRGNVAFLRTRAAYRTSLYLRRVGRPATLVTQEGGDDVALSGDHIAQIRDGSGEAGLCELPTVEVRRPDGAVHRIARKSCGENGQRYGSLAFLGRHLLFLSYEGSAGTSRTRVFRTTLNGNRLERAEGPRRAVAYAPSGPRAGVALIEPASSDGLSMRSVRELAFASPGPAKR
jgi:hypothetical protein